MDCNYIQIDKYSPIPLYEQLKGSLVKAIRKGELKPGHKLPTETEICKRYSISRPVVRQAYGELFKMGMLERKRGSGSFVKLSTDRGIFLNQLVSYQEELAMIGLTPGTDLKRQEIITWNEVAYEKLGLSHGGKCLHVERMRYASGSPFTYIENYVPAALFPGIETHDYGRESLYHVMKDCFDVYPVRAFRSIKAEVVRPELAHLLHVEKKAPVHLLESIAYDQYDRPVDYSIETYPGNTHRFDFVVYKD